MTGPASTARRAPAPRDAWLTAMTVATAAPFVLAVALAPPSGANPQRALVWLLFVGSSVHVAATGWFYAVPEVRAHMRRHPARYRWVPLALIVGLAVLTAAIPEHDFTAVLLAYFAWQFFHFQKQNLGVAALAARAAGRGALPQLERRALEGTGVGGIAALLGHPALLQVTVHHRSDLIFIMGGAVFTGSAAVGLAATLRRPSRDRILYVSGLLFFAPVFVFRSPYAAVAGLTVAHGLQYLLLLGLLAAGPDAAPGRTDRRLGAVLLANIALGLGLALNLASHLHSAHGPARAVYGAYLGVATAHFVIDAGLWRLREEFPRAFLTQRLPYLLAVPG